MGGTEWHRAYTPYLPWADMADQSQHSLLPSWGLQPGRGRCQAPWQVFGKGRMGTQRAACHSHQPLEVGVGSVPSSPASRAW